MGIHPEHGPPPEVSAAFGVAGVPPRLLTGGQGRTWQAGDVILKPTGLPGEAEWRAEVLETLGENPEFRVARPVRAGDGRWTVSGWEAWHHVPGEPDVTRVEDVLRVGRAFHATLAGLPRPDFLDHRDEPWADADRVAWEEAAVPDDPPWGPLLAPLARARRPVDLPSQPVHGDLIGNVLFAADGPPVVIDWPVYFRPATWALAVVVIDAVTWYAAPVSRVDQWAHPPGWEQMLVRALIFRIATNEGLRRRGLPVGERPEDYHDVVAAVLAATRES